MLPVLQTATYNSAQLYVHECTQTNTESCFNKKQTRKDKLACCEAHARLKPSSPQVTVFLASSRKYAHTQKCSRQVECLEYAFVMHWCVCVQNVCVFCPQANRITTSKQIKKTPLFQTLLHDSLTQVDANVCMRRGFNSLIVAPANRVIQPEVNSFILLRLMILILEYAKHRFILASDATSTQIFSCRLMERNIAFHTSNKPNLHLL